MNLHLVHIHHPLGSQPPRRPKAPKRAKFPFIERQKFVNRKGPHRFQSSNKQPPSPGFSAFPPQQQHRLAGSPESRPPGCLPPRQATLEGCRVRTSSTALGVEMSLESRWYVCHLLSLAGIHEASKHGGWNIAHTPFEARVGVQSRYHTVCTN